MLNGERAWFLACCITFYSHYQLRGSENKTTVKLYEGWNCDTYKRLLHVPTKPCNDFYTITDIMVNGENINGEFVNILVAVKHVSMLYACCL